MSLFDLFFPIFCISCKKNGNYICKNCLKKVRILNRFDPTSNTYSIFKYEGVIRKAIIKIKYNFSYDIAKELADICTTKIRKIGLLENKKVTIIPIPLHIKRIKWRGFNQSDLIGKVIADSLKTDFRNDILKRTIQGKTQVGLRGIERVRNIRGKFAVNNSQINKNSLVIVFDDVATTGSTIKEATKTLRKAGFKHTFGLTIAKQTN